MKPTLRTLGSVSLQDASGAKVPGRRRILGLLAWLVRNGSRTASREYLASLLWESQDSTRARHSLRQALSELRSLLPDGAITVDGERIALGEDAVALDADRFEQCVAEGSLPEAVGLYGGEFLAGLDDVGGEEWSTWLAGERARIDRQLGAAFGGLVQEAMARGAANEAVAAAERWCALQPLDEAPVTALIRASLAGGERIAAAAHHQAFLATLRAEGLEPSSTFAKLGRSLSDAPAEGRKHRGLLSPDLCGREQEFAQLSSLWAQARDGGSGTVVIEGDEGSGRSRLVDEFIRAARLAEPGAIIVEARSAFFDAASANRTLTLLADGLAAAPGLLGASRSDLQALAVVSPLIAELLSNGDSVATTPLLADALPRVLAAVGEEVPVLLAVDDVDLADAESQEVLSVLAQRPPSGVLLLMSIRVDRRSGERARERLMSAAARGTLLRLGPLDRGTTAAMIRSMAPFAEPSVQALADAAVEDLGGLPGHTRALVAAMADDGRLTRDVNGSWRLSGELERPVVLPDATRDAGRESLRAVSPDARKVLEVASTAGARVELAQLERAVALRPSAFQDALAELLATRRLRTVTGEGDVLEFPSEAARRAVFESLGAAQRERLRRRITPLTSRQRRARLMAAAIAAVAVIAVVSTAATRGRPVAGPGETLLLADVQNVTGDSAFDRTLTIAAGVALTESERFRVFPRSRVGAVLARMGRAEVTGNLGEELALEVAEREGIPVVLAISLESAEPGYLLVARLLAPGTGDTLRLLTEAVDDREEVLAGTGRLLEQVRRAMGESRAALAGGRLTLPLVTTPSIDALRSYAAGQEAWRRREYAPAYDLFKRALDRDPEFAMALASIAEFHYLVSQPDSGEVYLRRAHALSSRLTPRERLIIAGRLEDRVGNAIRGLEIRRELARRYPERDSWYNLGTALMRSGDCDAALPALRSALEYDPEFTNAHINVATCHLIQRSFDSALVAYEAAESTDSLALRTGNIAEEYGRALTLAGRENDAERHFRRMTAWGEHWNRARGHRQLAWMAMSAGRYVEAEREARRALSLLNERSSPVTIHRDRMVAVQALAGQGRTDEARRQFVRVWRQRPAAGLGVGMFTQAAALAWTIDAHGELAGIAAGIETQLRTPPIPAQVSALASVRALEALAAGRADDALRIVHEVGASEAEEWNLLDVAHAHALASAGQPEAAMHIWRRIADQPMRQTEFQEVWQLADLEVARLAEQLGLDEVSWEAVSRVVRRLQGADPGTPALREVEALVARLRTRR